MDMSKIQRALGFIEGVCTGLKEKEAELIEGAIVEIDCELEDMPGDCTTGIPSGHHVAAAPRNDSGSGDADAHDRMHYTTGEMDELVECLYKHHADYGQGYAQDYHDVCHDCRNAADVITMLREQLKDREYSAYVERP